MVVLTALMAVVIDRGRGLTLLDVQFILFVDSQQAMVKVFVRRKRFLIAQQNAEK